jgi:hypothetical protein
MNEDIFNGFGVEVFIDENNFLKIKETLSRIGVLSKKDNTLYQSCHILHKQGRYVIIHFKELFGLDNKIHEISENDIARRNTIVNLLQDWELLEIRISDISKSPLVPISQLKILSYKEKHNYNLVSKYNIGKVKK